MTASARRMFQAILLAVALHAVWFLCVPWSGAGPWTVRSTEPLTRLSYHPASPAADARWLWSPVLFSLPMPAGFSRANPDGGVLHPPVRMPEMPAPLLPPPVGETPMAVMAPSVKIQQEFPVAGAPVFSLPPPRSEVTLISGLDKKPESWVFPIPAASAGAQAWEAVVQLHFREDGLADHVFIENAGEMPEPLRPELTRAMFRWQAPMSVQPRGCTVRIRHVPQPEVRP